VITYTPPSGSNPASFVFQGYAFDPNDTVSGLPPASGPYYREPDVFQVQVGCLNGDFACPSILTWLNGVEGTGSYVTSGTLARAWQAPSAGYSWPAGEVAGPTFNDICQILNFDPLAVTPGECPTQNNYALLESLPSGTTSDGRYTKSDGPNPISYTIGTLDDMYAATYTSMQNLSQTTSTQIKQAFSLSEKFGASFLGLFNVTVNLKESDTLTWNYSTLTSLSSSNVLMNAFSITGRRIRHRRPPPMMVPLSLLLIRTISSALSFLLL